MDSDVLSIVAQQIGFLQKSAAAKMDKCFFEGIFWRLGIS